MNTTAETMPQGILPNTVLQDKTTYTVSGKQFIVQPVFPQDKKETLGQVLVKLMKSDIEKV